MAKRAANEMTDENIDSQQSVKRLKHEPSENSQRLLTDLHDDMLEPILKLLNLQDLLTMSQVSVRFQQSVNSVVVKRYSNKLVQISLRSYSSEKGADVLLLKELSTIIPFLKYFGRVTTKLLVEFDKDKSDQCLAIEESILKYCDALVVLELQNCRKGAFESIKKPFDLEVFRFRSGYLGQNLSKFNTWFPKLRSLTISHATVANTLCIQQTFPLLEHLDVKIGSASKKFSNDNIHTAISMNPQLRSIRVNNGNNITNNELKPNFTVINFMPRLQTK